MNSFIEHWLGEGTDLSTTQMAARGIIVFFSALIIIRLAGRRSFGMRMPFDNVVSILLGAILSRAVVGASPFVPILVCCTVIALLHRVLGWIVSRSSHVGNLIEGNKILLFRDNVFLRDNMGKSLVSEEDVFQGVRKTAQTEDLNLVSKVYMERNGEIYAVKK